jgi:hypothetical protein
MRTPGGIQPLSLAKDLHSMRQTTLLALTLVLGGASLFGADPGLLGLTPPDAQMYAGMNVTQSKTSQFGQFLLGQFPENSGFLKFVALTGFDPRRDLSEVLVATNSAPSTATTPDATGTAATMSGLFLAKGTFNIQQILTAAANDTNVTVSTYAGVSLVTINDEAHGPTLALLDSSTVVAGDVTSVKAAIDRRGTSSVIDPAIMATINQLSTSEDAWSVSTGNFASLVPMPGASGSNSSVLQGITQASAGVKFGAANSSNVQVNAQAIAKNATDADSLRDVIKLLAQMVQMHGGNSGTTSPVAALLQGLVVSADGNIVNVSLSVPEDQLESLIQQAHTNAHQGRASAGEGRKL